MTTLSSLVADVYSLTNRPDLESETLLAIRAATLKAHHSDFFYKDLLEEGIRFDFSLAQQSLDYKTLVPLWRALKYIRIYNQQDGYPGNFLSILTPEQTLDSYGVMKENICYVAGMQINIRTCAAQQYFLLGCYVSPNVTVESYSSWIADEYPMAIIYEAAATVFKAIGFDEQTAAFRALAFEEREQLKLSNILATGE